MGGDRIEFISYKTAFGSSGIDDILGATRQLHYEEQTRLTFLSDKSLTFILFLFFGKLFFTLLYTEFAIDLFSSLFFCEIQNSLTPFIIPYEFIQMILQLPVAILRNIFSA